MDNRYISKVLKINGVQIQVQAKLDDEGVVLDIFDEEGEVIDTICKEYGDFGVKTISFK